MNRREKITTTKATFHDFIHCYLQSSSTHFQFQWIFQFSPFLSSSTSSFALLFARFLFSRFRFVSTFHSLLQRTLTIGKYTTKNSLQLYFLPHASVVVPGCCRCLFCFLRDITVNDGKFSCEHKEEEDNNEALRNQLATKYKYLTFNFQATGLTSQGWSLFVCW